MALRHLCLTAGPADELYTSYKTPNRVLIKHFASSGSSFINWARASSRRTSWWLPGERQWTGQVYFLKHTTTFPLLFKDKIQNIVMSFARICITCTGVGKRIWFPLDTACRSCVFIDLLHRVEVNCVHTAQGWQTDLILPILVGCLQGKVIKYTPTVRTITFHSLFFFLNILLISIHFFNFMHICLILVSCTCCIFCSL